MAGVDVGGPSPRGKKGTGLRRPKRRIGIRIDMTPMVDIAFLLLIFYMVTTIFSMPQAMEINLPPEDVPVPIAESNLLTIRVDQEGKMFWSMGIEKPEPLPDDSLRALLSAKNQERPKLVTLIKIHKDARYFKMVDIIDEIQMIERQIKERNDKFSYRFSFAPFTDEDEGLITGKLKPKGGSKK
ncbi:MAG: biopolymer transporter ExbD [candidate division Zixibacteria bacterium]|nr:biopolymer transporter ExbD [candidate division Zixibacteria bacterium]